MANKTATLKNQAGDNIYPNIVGDNRNAAIKDSTTIKHTLTENKISLDLDEAVKGKIDAALQKPTGLTKTKLVGVGTNGQENIEIGDNLTLANGKLSATGGNNINIVSFNSDTGQFTGKFDINKINFLNIDEYIHVIENGYAISSESEYFIFTVFESDSIMSISAEQNIVTKEITFSLYIKSLQYKVYSHFITMTDSSSNVALYLTIQNTDETQFTAETLASYLAGEKVLANGNLHGVVPTYIAGEGGTIKVYYMTPGDSNINPTPDEYQDLSSFTITDLVSPVE